MAGVGAGECPALELHWGVYMCSAFRVDEERGKQGASGIGEAVDAGKAMGQGSWDPRDGVRRERRGGGREAGIR